MSSWYLRDRKIKIKEASGLPNLPASSFRAVRDKHTLWIWVDGLHFRLEKKPDHLSVESSSKESLAPMTAKVVDVPVKVGGSVAIGDVLVVLSAMKMEYIVKATAAGKIQDVLCAPNDMVDQGQVLVKLA